MFQRKCWKKKIKKSRVRKYCTVPKLVNKV